MRRRAGVYFADLDTRQFWSMSGFRSSQRTFTFSTLFFDMIHPLQWVSTFSGVVSCAIVAWLLWRSYGRVRALSRRLLIALGAGLLSFALFCLLQTGWEVVFPAQRINGHIIVYDVNIFVVVLVLIEIAIVVLRRGQTG